MIVNSPQWYGWAINIVTSAFITHINESINQTWLLGILQSCQTICRVFIEHAEEKTVEIIGFSIHKQFSSYFFVRKLCQVDMCSLIKLHPWYRKIIRLDVLRYKLQGNQMKMYWDGSRNFQFLKLVTTFMLDPSMFYSIHFFESIAI